MRTYADDHDAMGSDRSSRLSPYLHFGCLSPREIETRLPGGVGAEEFRRQLCWRDFYHHVLLHFPRNARSEFQERYRGAIRWSRAEVAFDAWREGRTGYPLVDAGMRQLLTEGWMHNRARLVVGSFLTKDLGIDWRWGERWFMRLLIDGDEANNNGNWQWIASVGVDPQPFFRRLYNPARHQERYDPEGEYVRRHVPELAEVPDEYLSEPWTMPAEVQERAGCVIGRDYPEPIVDHAAGAPRGDRALQGLSGRRAAPATVAAWPSPSARFPPGRPTWRWSRSWPPGRRRRAASGSRWPAASRSRAWPSGAVPGSASGRARPRCSRPSRSSARRGSGSRSRRRSPPRCWAASRRAAGDRSPQMLACAAIRLVHNTATTAFFIWVITGGLDAYAGTYDAIGRRVGIEIGSADALALTLAGLLAWAAFASVVQVLVYRRGLARWDELADAAEPHVDGDLGGEPRRRPSRERRFDPRAVALAACVAFVLLLVSTAWALLGAVGALARASPGSPPGPTASRCRPGWCSPRCSPAAPSRSGSAAGSASTSRPGAPLGPACSS